MIRNLLILLFIGISLLGCEDDMSPVNIVPELKTSEAKNITRNGAVVGGTLYCVNENVIIENCGVLYSVYSNMGVADTLVADDMTNGVEFSLKLDGLLPGTEYYFCTYVSSGYSVVKGEVRSFKTLPIQDAQFSETLVSNITSTSFTVKSSIIDDGGNDIYLMGFLYKEFESFDLVEDFCHDDEDVNVSYIIVPNTETLQKNIVDLFPSRSYGVRPFALGNNETYSYGDVKVVQMLATEIPALSSVEFSDTTDIGVTLNAHILSEGTAEVTEYGFCYSFENKEPNINNRVLRYEGSKSEYSGVLTGLSKNTRYYVRAYAKNEIGVAYGAVREYYVEYNPEIIYLPTVNSAEASSVSESSALLYGKIESDGGGHILRCGFCWSTEQAVPTVYNLIKEVQLNESNEYSIIIDGLSLGKTYYFRFFAENESGVAYSDAYSFTTVNNPIDSDLKDYDKDEDWNKDVGDNGDTNVNIDEYPEDENWNDEADENVDTNVDTNVDDYPEDEDWNN